MQLVLKFRFVPHSSREHDQKTVVIGFSIHHLKEQKFHFKSCEKKGEHLPRHLQEASIHQAGNKEVCKGCTATRNTEKPSKQTD